MSGRTDENPGATASQFLQLPKDQRRPSQDSLSSATNVSSFERSDTYAGSHTSETKLNERWNGHDSPINASDGRFTSMSRHSIDLDATRRRTGGSENIPVYINPRLINAQRVWMNRVMRMHPASVLGLVDEGHLKEIEDAWTVIEEFVPQVIGNEGESTFLWDHPLPSAIPAHGSEFLSPLEAANRAHVSYEHNKLQSGQATSLIEDAPQDYEALYYKHASMARNRSDDLINHGLSPDDYVLLDGEDSRSGAELPSPRTTPGMSFEHAERLSKLIQDITYHEQQAKKYKELCLATGIELEDDGEEELLEDDEDVYVSMLPEVGQGIPRLDAILALNEHQQQRDMPELERRARSAPSSKILEWQSGITTSPVEAPSIDSVHDAQPEPPTLIVTQHSSRDFSRELSIIGESQDSVTHDKKSILKHHRRCKSNPFPERRVVDKPKVGRRERSSSPAIFLLPERSDSGCSF